MKAAYVKLRVIQIHVQTANIRTVKIHQADTLVHVPHRHAGAGTNAKVRLPVFRTIRTLRIQDCVKSYKQKAVQRTPIVPQKRSVQMDIASIVTPAPPTAIVQAENIAVRTVIAPSTIKCLYNVATAPRNTGGCCFMFVFFLKKYLIDFL